MNGGSDPYKPYHFLKRVLRKLSDAFIQVALTDSGFLLRSAQNCKKCTFLDNLRAIIQEARQANMETRQMAPFFYLLFPL